MARGKVMADLAIRIITQTGELKKGLDKANKKVGGFTKQVAKIGDLIKGAFAFGAILEFGKAIVANIEKFTALNTKIAQFTGLAGGAVDVASGRISAMADMFGESSDDILIAANNLSKGMGVSFNEALEIIENGFLTGANASGELLDTVKEYPRLLKESGFNAEEFVGIISRSTKQGIFSDKGVDSIKEAGLRLREMTPATEDALKMVGISGKKLSQSLADGTLSVKQAIEIVSGKIAELPEDSKEVGTLLADVFGGAGEDAGVKWVAGLSKGFDESDELMLTSAQQTKKELLKAQSELSTQWSRIFGAQSEGWQKLKKLAVKATSGIIKGIRVLFGGAQAVADIATENIIDDFIENAGEKENESKTVGKKLGGEIAEGIDIGISEKANLIDIVPKGIGGKKGFKEEKEDEAAQINRTKKAVVGLNQAIKEKNELAQESIEQEETQSAAVSLLTDAFSGLGNAIVSGLDQGQSALKTFKTFFIQFAKSLIAKLITMIITALVLTSVLSALGIGAAGGLKGAAEGVKFGKALGENLKSLGGFANGGVSTGGLAMVGERGKELIALPQGARVMSNGDMRNAISGGGMTGAHITIDDMVLRGEDIRISFKEAERKAGNTV